MDFEFDFNFAFCLLHRQAWFFQLQWRYNDKGGHNISMAWTNFYSDWRFRMSTEFSATILEHEISETGSKVSAISISNRNVLLKSSLFVSHNKLEIIFLSIRISKSLWNYELKKKNFPFLLSEHFWQTFHVYQYFFHWHGFVVWPFIQHTFNVIHLLPVTQKSSIRFYHFLSTTNWVIFQVSWAFS